MPYTVQERRQPYTSALHQIEKRMQQQEANIGDFTYLITAIAVIFTKMKTLGFRTFCMVIGAFMCAAFEYYRRVMVEYEDGKRKENGDVY